jgi:hypothetical protein
MIDNATGASTDLIFVEDIFEKLNNDVASKGKP